MDIIEKAKVFAFAAHAAVGQVRKYTGEPYSEHTAGVASIVSRYTGAPSVIAAAHLHDVLEDTQVTHSQLVAQFGEYIAGLVLEVTDVSRKGDGVRAVRKAMDCRHVAGASSEGQTIKLADLIHNTASIVEHDPSFARIYLMEKHALLRVLTRGHAELQREAWRSWDKACRDLGVQS